jgi:hypothetical protein
VAEVLVDFAQRVSGPDGREYLARACGSETATGLWQGWVEFNGPGWRRVIRSAGERRSRTGRTPAIGRPVSHLCVSGGRTRSGVDAARNARHAPAADASAYATVPRRQ